MMLVAAVAVTVSMFAIAAVWFTSENQSAAVPPTADSNDKEPPETNATRVTIQTTPAGAAVWIDDDETGISPKELSVTGRHTIRARLDGYEEGSTVIDTAEPTATVTLVLKPKPARYTLRISPPGATVEVASSMAQVSGAGKERIVDVSEPDGKRSMLLRVALAGYTPLERTLTPKPGEATTLDLSLVREKPVVTTIHASATPVEAKLTLISRGAEVDPPGRGGRHVWKITITDPERYRKENPESPETLRYRWSLDGYEDETVTIALTGFGISHSETTRLTPIPASPPPADDSAPDGWRDISETRPAATMAVFTVAKDGTISSVGPFRVTTTENGSGKQKLELNWPGSLWFMAEGGSRGIKVFETMVLAAGKIYEFDSDRKPHLVNGQKYSVWISHAATSSIYTSKSATAGVRIELPAGRMVRLISVNPDLADGWHEVQTREGVKGWMRGSWSTTTFMERTGR